MQNFSDSGDIEETTEKENENFSARRIQTAVLRKHVWEIDNIVV